MSLDVYLRRKKWVSYDKGETWEEELEEVFWSNITHNLNEMAAEAGIYQSCSKCGWDTERNRYDNEILRNPTEDDFLNGDADFLTDKWY